MAPQGFQDTTSGPPRAYFQTPRHHLAKRPRGPPDCSRRPRQGQSSWKFCLYAVGPMSRCVSFVTIIGSMVSEAGYHHQHDYECNSTGSNMALFYFGMDIFSLPGHAIRDKYRQQSADRCTQGYS